MKHLLLTTIAAVVLVGCATTQSPELLISKAPDISIHEAVAAGNIKAVKQHLTTGLDVNAKDKRLRKTPLDWAITGKRSETADLLRKHGGKTAEELKAEGK